MLHARADKLLLLLLHTLINPPWFIIPLTDCADVNIQRCNIRWQCGGVRSERQQQSPLPHPPTTGQSVAATHNYLLGHIFTLYPSLCGHPVRSHLFMFITASHLPSRPNLPPGRMIDIFQEGAEVGLARASSSPIAAQGGRGLPIHTMIMSQLADTSETITLGGSYTRPGGGGRLGGGARRGASGTGVRVGGSSRSRRSCPRAPLFFLSISPPKSH